MRGLLVISFMRVVRHLPNNNDLPSRSACSGACGRIEKMHICTWCSSSQLYPIASLVPSGGGAKCLQQQRTSKRNKIQQKCPKITALSCTDAHPPTDLSFRAPNRYRNDASWSKALFFCFSPVFLNRPTPHPLFFHLTGTKTAQPLFKLIEVLSGQNGERSVDPRVG
jgi:hypothetical protein